MPSAIDSNGPSHTSSSPVSGRRLSKKILSRNIDQVVLGDVVFDTWYYSDYPNEPILPKDPKSNGLHSNGDFPNGNISDSSQAGASGRVCSRLHVCPYCFCYSPIVEEYVVHLRHHQQLEKEEPSTPPVPATASKVYEHEGYAIWEVDGEQEKLYCQNLSLFGKLFLEQKSVFFDTGGFLYFVLTYTPPDQIDQAPSSKKGRTKAHDAVCLRTQVLGFFSKENPSWDSNNLACILIFPPFQHRQLGKLLMAVSYKLSGWEWEGGVIGGPEKPLSAMGKKSYLRFWSERIARFMLGESADADQKHVFEKKRKKTSVSKEEITIKEIGNRTGMLPEDVVAALNEMGVCEMVIRRKKKTLDTNGVIPGQGVEADDPPPLTMSIKRSKILEWAKANRIDLIDPVKEEGFLGEWAASDANDEDSESNASQLEG